VFGGVALPLLPGHANVISNVRTSSGNPLLGVEFPAHLDEPGLEVGMSACVLLEPVNDRQCTGAELIHR